MFSDIEAKLRTIGCIHVALDTCVIALMDEGDPRKRAQWESLQEQRTAGRISWTVATRLVQDKMGDPDAERRQRHLAEGAAAPTPSIFRWDESFLDVDVFDGVEGVTAELELLYKVKERTEQNPESKNLIHDLRDIDHIEAAIRAGADAFLTTDDKILKKREFIHSRWGLRICSPKEILDLLNGQAPQ